MIVELKEVVRHKPFHLLPPATPFIMREVVINAAPEQALCRHLWMKLAPPSNHLAVNLHDGRMVEISMDEICIAAAVKVVDV